RRQQSDAHERDEKKISRTAKSRRQPREEIPELKPVVRTGEEKDGDNGHLQWQPTRQHCRKPGAGEQDRRECFRRYMCAIARSACGPYGYRNVLSSFHAGAPMWRKLVTCPTHPVDSCYGME